MANDDEISPSKSDKTVINAGPSDSSKSDISNPFFTHHSDHPGLVLVSKPLNGDNYSGWKRAMTLALNSKNKLGFVNGTIKPPSKETDPDGYEAWSRCNDMVHSWIINTVNPEIADSVIYYPTTHEVWEDLSERFSQGNAPQIFEIQREIACLRQEQQSVSTYYTKLKSFWDELASYSEISAGSQGYQQRLMQFLMGLNETYSAIRGQILLMNPLPTVRQAYAAVSQEEKQRLLSAPLNSADSSGSAAMAVRNSGRSNSNSGRGNRFERADHQNPRQNRNFDRNFSPQERRQGFGRGRPHCSHCGDPGHWVQTCFELIGYPPGHPKAKQVHQNPKSSSNNHWNASFRMPTANNVISDEVGPSVTLSEAQFNKFLAAVSNLPPRPNPHAGTSPKANAVTKPGSGYEEDDWFG